VATAGVIYYYWAVKSDLRFLLAYGAILSGLLLYRAAVWFKVNRRTERESDLRAA
jgi:DMSO/TMAO reductase YedYZ heme-binding membrane subunit